MVLESLVLKVYFDTFSTNFLGDISAILKKVGFSGDQNAINIQCDQGEPIVLKLISSRSIRTGSGIAELPVPLEREGILR